MNYDTNMYKGMNYYCSVTAGRVRQHTQNITLFHNEFIFKIATT